MPLKDDRFVITGGNMLNNRIKSIKIHNENLVMDYLSNYEEIDQMHGAYRNYAGMLLGWADGRDLLRAPKFRANFPQFLSNRSEKAGRPYSENYVYASCLFARDFFRYCKTVLPEEDTGLISDYWLKNLVPQRSSSKRLSFIWLTDEDLEKIMEYRFEQNRLKRAQAAILLAAVTGMSRSALLSIPIREINLKKLLVYQYPERGVCTEKLACGTTHIFPQPEIIGFLKKYTDELKKVSPADCTWFIRYSRHGAPQPVKFGEISDENRKEAYKFALTSYGRLKEDLVKVSEACKIPKVTLSIAQNTFIYQRLRESCDQDSVEKITQDLLLKDPAPVKQCLKLLNSQKKPC